MKNDMRKIRFAASVQLGNPRVAGIQAETKLVSKHNKVMKQEFKTGLKGCQNKDRTGRKKLGKKES